MSVTSDEEQSIQPEVSNSPSISEEAKLEDEDSNQKKNPKSQKKFQELVKKEKKRGVCYLSRVPPHMKPLKLRHLLEPYGEILRIYLAPEDASVRLQRKKAGGNRGKNFTEGWVEFAKKKVAKGVAQLLNGEPMDPKRRSAYHYDLWNIKYLHKFKWDNLTEEIAYRNAVREEKLRTEISKATKERDFYLTKVDQSKAIQAMSQRKRKRKGNENTKDAETNQEESEVDKKVIRHFFQRKAVGEDKKESEEVLRKVLGSGSKVHDSKGKLEK